MKLWDMNFMVFLKQTFTLHNILKKKKSESAPLFVVNKVDKILIPDFINKIRKNREKQSKSEKLWVVTKANDKLLSTK